MKRNSGCEHSLYIDLIMNIVKEKDPEKKSIYSFLAALCCLIINVIKTNTEIDQSNIIGKLIFEATSKLPVFISNFDVFGLIIFYILSVYYFIEFIYNKG